MIKHHPSFYKDFPHSMEDRTPYTYLIGWLNENMWYYGRRTFKGCHPTELFNVELSKKYNYCTSSDIVHEFILKYGYPDIIQIRQTFNNIELCKKWENRFLIKTNAAKNIKFLNKTNGDCNFDRTLTATVKDSNGIYSSCNINDPRYLSGELVHVNKGRAHSDKFKKECSIRSEGNQRSVENIYTAIMPDGLILNNITLYELRTVHNICIRTLLYYVNIGKVRPPVRKSSIIRENVTGWSISAIAKY